MKKYQKKTIVKTSILFGLLFFYTFLLASSNADDFNAICKNTLDNNQTTSQIYTYCQSALASKKAAEASTIAWKVWAAVLGVCAAACVAPLVSGGLPYICPAVSVSAFATDIALTKNFSNAMMGIFTLGAPLMMSYSSKKETSLEKTTSERKFNTSACALSANAGLMIFMDYNNTQNSLNAEKASLKSAQSLISANTLASPSNPINSTSILPTGLTTSATNTNITPPVTNMVQPNMLASTANLGRYCTNPNMMGSRTGSPLYTTGMNTMMQCAFAASPQLPPSVSTPQFDSNFQKVSGISLGEYLTNPKNQSPTSAVYGATKNLLTADQSTKFIQDFQKMGQQWQSGGTYTATKHPSLEKSSDIFSNFVDQLHPKPKEEIPSTSEINFKSIKHQDDQIIKTDSLFERISHYYENYCRLNQKETNL